MMEESLTANAAMLLRGSRRVHLIGVAGSGMSGLAGLLLALGHKVSGSDRVSTVETRRLERAGLIFSLPQTAESVRNSELVIYSSAIKPGNPAFDEATRLGVSMLRRAEALAAIMTGKKGVIVAGMHGKTTTSSMAAHVLRVGGLNPSHYVGAEIPLLGTNSYWDRAGEYFVAEGDESDGTLRHYQPEHSIILNIEEEHLDYYKGLVAIEAVFHALAARTRDSIFYCSDDPHSRRIFQGLPKTVSFGSTPDADYQCRAVVSNAEGSKFEVWRGNGERLGQFELGVPGLHNVSNALAVFALADVLNISFDSIAQGLMSFRGARRRFETKYRSEDFIVVDDYGHHPTEIKATLATARNLGRNRVVVMFQPHRYSRTQAFQKQFGSAFDQADLVYITEVYAAGESPIPGISGASIAAALKANLHPGVFYVPNRTLLHSEVAGIARPGDLLLSLGAGDIHEEASKIVSDFKVAADLRDIMGPGELRLYEPLSRHTTLRVGGPAQFWLEPQTRSGLANILEYCSANRVPVMFIGRGSNLLVRDGGIPGAVIHLNRGQFVETTVMGNTIRAGAGVRLKQLSALARSAGLGGFEWMEGIPGSVGGSLRMNAGAMGQETFAQVVEVQLVSAHGEFDTLSPDQMDVHYRNVPTLRDRFAVSATFHGVPAQTSEIDRLLTQSAAHRKTTQPIAASAGCIFKNPSECPAGRLVEELGLKNRLVGRARVSEIHGNFIVNDGGSTAREILQLISEVQKCAKDSRGIVLETEVQVVGIDEVV
jgi:UDP-N-acetylmuramate--alanine ligase